MQSLSFECEGWIDIEEMLENALPWYVLFIVLSCSNTFTLFMWTETNLFLFLVSPWCTCLDQSLVFCSWGQLRVDDERVCCFTSLKGEFMSKRLLIINGFSRKLSFPLGPSSFGVEGVTSSSMSDILSWLSRICFKSFYNKSLLMWITYIMLNTELVKISFAPKLVDLLS